MPVLTNSIGGQVFWDLTGPIFLTQQQIELFDRPGVDGTGLRLTGTRGKPFQMVSVSYHTTFTAWQTYLAACVALKTSLQTLTRNSISYGSVAVLEVTEAKPPQAVVNVAGAPGAGVRAEIKWMLLIP